MFSCKEQDALRVLAVCFAAKSSYADVLVAAVLLMLMLKVQQ